MRRGSSVDSETGIRDSSQTGVYASARFKPTDDLAVITGGRVVNWRLHRGGFNWSGDFAERYQENGEVVPSAGVAYDLTEPPFLIHI